MRHLSSLRLGATLALAAATSIHPAGQTRRAQPPAQEQPPTFRVEANFVRVDVYPMRDGRPVQGLRVEDFELLEDGVPQRIETFEYVRLTPAGPQAYRVEPGSVREGNQMAADPRRRVFVLFLDTYHVTYAGSHGIRGPIMRMLERVLSEEDLVGVMTPTMNAAEVTLARRTEVLETGLTENWVWGIEQSFTQYDDTERRYQSCYQFFQGGNEIAAEMIARRREKQSVDALHDLVIHLRVLREERKAIVAVSDGWRRFRPNPNLARTLIDPLSGRKHVPGPPPIGIGPGGRLVMGGAPEGTTEALYECDRDRLALADLDNERSFRDLVETANRATASFYTVDPRGLAVFDSPIGPEPPPSPGADQASLRSRIASLEELALGTDGLAVVNHNDLDKGLRRISDDLSSYYLLGYYSTNTRLDGGYRRLTVRVKQPRVEVRARRGYRAATAEEVAEARRAAEAPAPDAVSAVTTALASLARIRPDTRFRITAAALRGAPGTVWIAGEVPAGDEAVTMGAVVDVEASAAAASSTTRITLKPRERTFLASLKAPGTGEQPVSIRARLTSESLEAPLTDAVQIESAEAMGQPMLFRRGPSTANRVLPAADYRFFRTERLRLEIPVAAGVSPVAGRVLDRAGEALQVPVTLATRAEDGTGQQWITAEVTLAPLAPSDYAIEVTAATPSGEQRVVTAIRIGR